MRVLFVGPEYHYMKPEQGQSFVYHYFLGTLQHMPEVDVDYMPFERMYEVGRDTFNEELRAMVSTKEPDVLFVVLFGDELKKENIADISKHTSTKTVAWFSDDQWRFENYSRFWAPCFQWVVTTDAKTKERYIRMGYQAILSQWAWASTFFFPPEQAKKKYPVTFVGESHGKRKKILDTLKKEEVPLECWGYGWPRGMVSQEEMCTIFSQSNVNLNFNKSSGRLDARALGRIFLRKKADRQGLFLEYPKRWLANIRSLAAQFSDQIKLRNFEVTGCGGFLLAEYVPGLERYYEPGKEIECFSGVQELIDKTRYYLEHEAEREQIARAGHARTLADHTLEKRLREIFQTVGLLS